MKMTILEEKKWLRAILEGKLSPADKAWKRVAKDAEFARIRQSLKAAERLKLDDRCADLQSVWQELEQHRDAGVNRRRIRSLHYVAAAITVLLLVAGGWFTIWHIPSALPLAEGTVCPVADTARVVLIMAGGSRVYLSVLSGDTVIQQGKTKIRLNPVDGVVYESSEQTFSKVEYNQIIVPHKCRYQIKLADGTKVFLNAGSELRYPVSFAGNERKVFLEGEAYFEVMRDTAHPFSVETAEQNIRVLGTSFNIYAYSDEPMNYISLVSGKVAVADKKTGTDRVLKPGQQVVLDAVTGKTAVREANMQQVLGWRNRDLIVREETLEVIMAKVARWYDVEVKFAQESLKKMCFTANLHEKKDLQELLKVIAIIGDLRVTFQEGVVIIDFK